MNQTTTATTFQWTPALIAQCLAQWSPPTGASELRWNGKQWVAK